MANTTRSATIAILGAPNAGKSTLTNALVGGKISIVSKKVQTTRCLITGIAQHHNTQFVLLDTPGIFRPRKKLDHAMVEAAWSSLQQADFCMILIDVMRGITPQDEHIIREVAKRKIKPFYALNKIDRIEKSKLLSLSVKLNQMLQAERTYMISALEKDGLTSMLEDLVKLAPTRPWAYPADQISTAPMKFLAAEITREKLFETLHQELPYELMVVTDSWEELGKSVKIHQTIYVTRDSHKNIVVGKGGQMLKTIGEQSRKEIGAILGHPAHLFLFVKVKENWADSRESLSEIGLA